MNAQLKTLIYIAAIFIAGAATGGIVGVCSAKRMMFRHPPRPHEVAEHMRAQLQAKLNLTAEQQKKINPILDQTDAALKAIHMETMTKVAKAIDDTHAKIAAELTPEQKLKLQAMERDRPEFLHRRPFGPPPSPQDRNHPPGRFEPDRPDHRK